MKMYSDMYVLCLVRQARDIGPLNELFLFDFIC